MKSFSYILLLFLGVGSEDNSWGIFEKARLLIPISYSMAFDFQVNITQMQFNYSVVTEINFTLRKDFHELVMECTVPELTLKSLIYKNPTKLRHDLSSDIQELRSSPTIIFTHKKNGTLFKAGNYSITVFLRNSIYSIHGKGIQYSRFTDSVTKKPTYSILMNFWPSYAKHVTLALSDVNTISRINVSVKHKSGFHGYLVKQAKFTTHLGNITETTMYKVDIPLGFLTLYLTQNVRLTKAYLTTSATVTAGRNQIGKFTEQYQYILDLFYSYFKKYNHVWSRKLPFLCSDIFLHLHQNLTKDTVNHHTACFVSMPYVLMLYRNHEEINYFMSRCIAANHLMTRRYPLYWNAYYIQLGLLEYYSIMWQQKSGNREPSISVLFGEKAILSLAEDDVEGISAIMSGEYTWHQDYYHKINEKRALSFMYMLKNLIYRDKDRTFDEVVATFLSDQKVLYHRDHFIQVFLQVTQNLVFSNTATISRFFDTWTRQRGYPFVVVERRGNILRFMQVYRKDLGINEPFMIPISVILEPRAIRHRENTHPDLWMTQRKVSLQLLNGDFKWYLINNQRTGYYRVMYDAWNYKLLRIELLRGDMHKIHPISRGQLLDDSLFLARYGFLHYKTALELLEYLKIETDEVPWRVAALELHKLIYYLRLTKVFGEFKIFMQTLSRKFYRKQVEEASELSKEAIRWACLSELPQCKKLTHDLFMGFLLKRKTVQHLDQIICEGVKSVDKETYEYIKLSLLTEVKGLEQDLYLTALVCPYNEKFLTETLNMLFRKTSEVAGWLTPLEKGSKLLMMFKESENGVTAILDFVYIHPTLVLQNLGGEVMLTMLTELSRSLYRRAHQRKLRNVVKYLKLGNTAQMILNMDTKRKWLGNHEVELRKILTNLQEEFVDEYLKI